MKLSINSTGCDLVKFYDRGAKTMGYSKVNNLKYDCRKINIAPNIQENFFARYKEIILAKQPVMSESDINANITILLAMSGPKVDASLKANEVEVFDGFITKGNDADD